MAGKNALLDKLLSRHLGPALKAAGFERKGRTFRRTSENGESVVAEVQTASGSMPERAKFHLNIALVPVPWLESIRESTDPVDLRDPQLSEGLVSGRVVPAGSDVRGVGPQPGDIGLITDFDATARKVFGRGQESFWDLGAWVFDPETIDEVGVAIKEAVERDLPEYFQLLDHAELLRRLRTGQRLPGTCPRRAALAAMLVEHGLTDEFESALADFGDRDQDFIQWARRAAQRAR